MYKSDRKRKVIKQDELLKRLLTGQPLLIGEYRGTACELIKYTDKATGKPETFMKIGHTVECTLENGSLEVVNVEERAPKGFDNPALYVSGLTKGQRVALRLDGLQRIKGRVVASVSADDDSIVSLS